LLLDGSASMDDDMGVYVERTIGQVGQHIVLMYTDGGDSTSRAGVAVELYAGEECLHQVRVSASDLRS
jgi:hypothetical protein